VKRPARREDQIALIHDLSRGYRSEIQQKERKEGRKKKAITAAGSKSNKLCWTVPNSLVGGLELTVASLTRRPISFHEAWDR
jgi:hypothetical protein